MLKATMENLKFRVGRFYYNFRYVFKTRKLLLVLRVFANICKILLFKGIPLRSVDFAPSYDCNLECKHCFAESLKKTGEKTLTPEDYKRIADECIKLGAVHFAIQGGEPLLLPHLEEMVKFLQPEKCLISVTTNGTMLTNERINSLRKAGVDMFTFSLDSIDAEEHDLFRGARGAHNKVCRMIKSVLNAGMGVTINTIVSHENIRNGRLIEMVGFAKKSNIKLNLVFPVPVGRWAGNEHVILTGEEKKFIKTMMEENPHVRRDLDSGYVKYGCGAVKEMIYISAYGDVFPCPFMHASIGNVNIAPLKEIIEKGRKIKCFTGYQPYCLVAEDKDFIRKRLGATFDRKQLPIRIEEMFSNG
jgi:MoaA/NifB/PqqE/SkfB family radical SAM enzyme